jgi:hypothetical protein
MVGRQVDGGDPGCVGGLPEVAGVWMRSRSEQHTLGQARDVRTGHTQPVQRGFIREEVGAARPCQQFRRRGRGQRRGEQHGHRAYPGGGTGKEGDVEPVPLVHGDPLARPDASPPKSRGELVDEVGHFGSRRSSAETRCDVEAVIENEHVRRIPGSRSLEEPP